MHLDPAQVSSPAGVTPNLDRMLALYPHTTGDPAFDPDFIAAIAEGLQTDPEVDTGHPFLDRSVKVGLAHISATFQGDHPKYGVKVYADPEHDGFPPTIIAAVDALTKWGLQERAEQLFHYWLLNFVRDDGSIDYYGPSLSEFGQLLHTAASLANRAGARAWLKCNLRPLEAMATRLLSLFEEAKKTSGLLSGVPEADMRSQVATYFHNNAWVATGLAQWAGLLSDLGDDASQSGRGATAGGQDVV